MRMTATMPEEDLEIRDRLIATEEPIAVLAAIGAQALIGALGRRRRPQVVRGDRINLLTRRKTSKGVRSEVHDHGSGRESCAERLARRRRKKDVAAIREATDSRRQIHGRTEVGSVALLGRTGV